VDTYPPLIENPLLSPLSWHNTLVNLCGSFVVLGHAQIGMRSFLGGLFIYESPFCWSFWFSLAADFGGFAGSISCGFYFFFYLTSFCLLQACGAVGANFFPFFCRFSRPAGCASRQTTRAFIPLFSLPFSPSSPPPPLLTRHHPALISPPRFGPEKFIFLPCSTKKFFTAPYGSLPESFPSSPTPPFPCLLGSLVRDLLFTFTPLCVVVYRSFPSSGLNDLLPESGPRRY